jgi:hypothetical protein
MLTAPATLYPVWVHRLVLPFRYGPLLTSMLILAVMWMLLNVGAKTGELGFYSKLFFAAMCAYIVPVFRRTVERSVIAFNEIEGMLNASRDECDHWRRTLTHRSPGWFLVVTTFALAMGVLNIALSQPAGGRGVVEDILSGRGEYTTYVVILLIWVTMTTAITALISNARLFGQLSRRLRIDLLHCPALLSVARVAVMSTLSIIGAQVLFVFLMLDADAKWVTILPGFVAMTVPELALFLIPVWPLHLRLQAAKQQELAKINRQIEQQRPEAVTALDDAQSLDQLNRLLFYRREINQVSEWPFDMPVLTRLGLYLILPPLTWVGAALIENLVDALL